MFSRITAVGEEILTKETDNSYIHSLLLTRKNKPCKNVFSKNKYFDFFQTTFKIQIQSFEKYNTKKKER